MINTEPTQLTMPVFNLNGTPLETLTREYYNAYTKLQEFIDKFSEIEFHSRDYYLLGTEAWNKACNERDQARRNINEVYKYLEAHVQYCYDNSRN